MESVEGKGPCRLPGVVMTAPGESTTRNVLRRRAGRLWLQLALCICMCISIYIYVYIHMLYRLQDLIFFASRVYAGSSLIFFVCVHAIENSAMDVFLAEGPKMSLGHPYRNYGIAVHELFLV